MGEGKRATFVCDLCGGSFERGDDYEALAEMDALFGDLPIEDRAVVCDACFHRVIDGVCGATRRDYACLRPKEHEPADQHASMDGRWWVYWSDSSLGVTLRRRTDVA